MRRKFLVNKNSTLQERRTFSSRKTALLLVVLLAVNVAGDAVAGPDWTDCPASCKCKWSSGKKNALCTEAGLSTVPSFLNGEVQVLDLSGNPIPTLGKDAFSSVGLLNLQRIYLKGCGVKEINRDAFRDLNILVAVDLSSNGLTVLHPQTFLGNNRLRELYLSGNPLNELREEQFPPLPHLRQLEMRSCRLKHVNKRAFVHLTYLETLILSNNKLRYLSEAVFTPLTKITTLALDGNPWKCDCHLRDFRTWLLTSKLYSLPLFCSEPEALNGQKWQDIDPMEYACSPHVELSDTMVQGEVGGNATFGCLVRGDPEPHVQWVFNGHIINNNGSDPDRIIDEYGEGTLEKWLNITLSNLTDSYVGEYSCIARNTGGRISRNLTLILPEVVTATTLSKAESWLLMAGLVAGGAGAVTSALLGGLCLCLCSRQRRKRRKRKSKLTGSVSYTTDQEKKLLDASLTERASGTVSFEGMSQTDMELLTRDPSTVDLSEPVHITIENLPSDIINSNNTGSNGNFPGAPYVIPPPLPSQPLTTASNISAQQQQQSLLPRGTLAPPPEFSSTIPPSSFGNIFISVSVSQDPNGSPNDPDNRYPDLLDIPHRSKTGGSTAAAISVTTGSDGLRQFPYHHHHHLTHQQHPHHHHHTLHHHHTKPLSSATTCVPDGNKIGAETMLAAACATLPRRPRATDKNSPLVRMRPHYDNMGPRVTAGGSSVLSLPEATGDEENDEELSEGDTLSDLSGQKRGMLQEIPTPPPPPLCTPLPPEYVSL
ncbi:hypothetical protein B566_EDAN002617 [Ephemera danica]|nr:hypothetical protein B566_EDAN002617 [Ephemera danica]